MFLDFIYNFYPNRVLFDFGFIKIYWYGLFVFIGLIFGFFAYYKLSLKQKIEKKHIFDSFFWTIVFGFFGARIVYCLYYFDYYFLNNPIDIIKVFDGGMSILGGIVFGFLALFVYSNKNKLNILKFLNSASIGLLIAQIFGRLGNYFNQELYGIPTDFILKIPISLENRVSGFENYQFFTPLFFYEILANIILFIVLIFLFNKKQKNNLEDGGFSMKNITVKDFRANMSTLMFVEKGGIALVYFNYYIFIRFVFEFFRLGENKFYFFSYNQIVSLFMILAFNLLWFFVLRKTNTKK